ncbi:MAG: hypothetical protein AB7L13_20540 [Acidimicrobiia bacterium]
MTALVLVETVALALLAVLVVGLLRSHAEILRALQHLGVDYLADDQGEPTRSRAARSVADRAGDGDPARVARRGDTATGREAVDIVGESPLGDATLIGLSNPDSTALLLFLSSGCDKCDRFWNALAAGAHRLLGLRVVAVTQGNEKESAVSLAPRHKDGVEIVMSSEAWRAFGVPGSPYAVFCDGGRVIGEGSALTWEQLASLVEQARGDLRESQRRANIDLARAEVERRRESGAAREAFYDEQLLAAGIGPHDPRLYHEAPGPN